jgi:hypothetical protein
MSEASYDVSGGISNILKGWVCQRVFISGRDRKGTEILVGRAKSFEVLNANGYNIKMDSG